MKIAQIAPLIESVPPRLYGGTERIVSYLTEELVAQGHDVTLFASADSNSVAEATRKIGRVLALDRARVRRRFEQRFTAERMVQDYVTIYEKLISTGLRRGADRIRPALAASSTTSHPRANLDSGSDLSSL